MTALATRMPGSTVKYRNGLMISIVGHALLLGALSSSVVLLPNKPVTQLAIQAVVVDESVIKKAADVQRRKADEQRERERSAAVEQQRREQEQRAAEQKRQQEAKAAEAQRREQQQQKDAEARVAAERQRKQAEADRKEQARVKAEAARKEQERQKAEAARKEQERLAAAARAKAEAEKREQARRQSELMTAMAAEEELLAARQSGELSEYLALIQQKVERNWVPPANVQPGLECEVAVVQLPNGDVVDAQTTRCNGDAAVRRSIENAVRRSSPLPLPENRALFERNLRFIFKPEE